jgi:hypothetical protein
MLLTCECQKRYPSRMCSIGRYSGSHPNLFVDAAGTDLLVVDLKDFRSTTY